MKSLNDDYGKYEFRKDYMKDQTPDDDRGGCLALATLFVVVMLSLMGLGMWMIWH